MEIENERHIRQIGTCSRRQGERSSAAVFFHIYFDSRASVFVQVFITPGRVAISLSGLGKGRLVISTGLLTISLTTLSVADERDPSYQLLNLILTSEQNPKE